VGRLYKKSAKLEEKIPLDRFASGILLFLGGMT
jgi:hypothetical protein